MSNEKETKVSALDAKAKALANEEDEDTKIAKLLKNMPKWRFYSLAVLTVIWTVFQLYIKLVKPLDPVVPAAAPYVPCTGRGVAVQSDGREIQEPQ